MGIFSVLTHLDIESTYIFLKFMHCFRVMNDDNKIGCVLSFPGQGFTPTHCTLGLGYTLLMDKGVGYLTFLFERSDFLDMFFIFLCR